MPKFQQQYAARMKLCLLLGYSILLSVKAFTHLLSSGRQQQTQLGRGNLPLVDTRSSKALASSSSSSSSSPLSSEIFLLSFDGTVARTAEWRITQGIEVALSVWPHLQERSAVASVDVDDEWLRNKMRAISSVLVARPGCSLSVDYALLARLLIEEQELDQGRSNGSSGKYGSKFHPQNTSSSSPQRERRDRGSRPLTVGEIAENWNRGGCLVDTVLTKYHVDYKNPLPILQEKIDELNEDGRNLPEMSCNDAILDAFEQSTGGQNLIVTVGHKSDLIAAASAIESIGMKTKVVSNEESLVESFKSNENENSVMLLPVSTTHGATYEDVVRCAPSGSTVYVFESSWSALEQGICLFGDRIPRGGTGMAETIMGRDILLSLNFPKWSATSPLFRPQETQSTKSQGDVAQQNEAMMNPWTNLVAESDFSELLSARIVPSSM